MDPSKNRQKKGAPTVCSGPRDLKSRLHRASPPFELTRLPARQELYPKSRRRKHNSRTSFEFFSTGAVVTGSKEVAGCGLARFGVRESSLRVGSQRVPREGNLLDDKGEGRFHVRNRLSPSLDVSVVATRRAFGSGDRRRPVGRPRCPRSGE